MIPDVLIVGHIVKDIKPDGWRLGGGAYYAAVQLSRLGLRVGVVTAYGEDVGRIDLHGTEWKVVRSAGTTTFENMYSEGRRKQRLLARALDLGFEDIPAEWRDAPLILLAPVAHEIDESLPGRLAGNETLLALGAQGWLRRVDGEEVLPGDVELEPRWLDGQVVFVSEEDVSDPESVSEWQQKARIVVLTRGRSGYTIWSADGSHSPEGQTAEEIDPTGAGDVFAAAFVYRYAMGADAAEAGRFAHAAAVLSVQAEGIDGIGDRAAIEAQMGREAAVGAG